MLLKESQKLEADFNHLLHREVASGFKERQLPGGCMTKTHAKQEGFCATTKKKPK